MEIQQQINVKIWHTMYWYRNIEESESHWFLPQPHQMDERLK